MAEIFVLAQHRTGSTLLKNMLDAHPDVCMAFDEMNLFEPLRRNTLDRCLSGQPQSPEEVVEYIFSGKVYGTFWKDFSKSGISRESLSEALSQEEALSAQGVLKQVLRLLSELAGVKNSGVKYPVHISRIKWLLDNFPGCRALFLFRNPMAIVASKINDEATKIRKKKTFLHRFSVHYFTLFYFCIEFRKAFRTFRTNQARVMKVCYEDLVQTPEATLRKICEYIGIEFHPDMISVTGKSSSYTSQAFSAPVVASVDQYKQRLSRFDRWLIRLLTEKPYKELL